MCPWKRYVYSQPTTNFLTALQNLREEVTMELDEEDDRTQQIRKVANFGIEVDFESLNDDERQVCII